MISVKNHVTRLSRYKFVLKQLKSVGMVKVFSENIADAAGVNSAQVRKDFSLFGITGNKKGGYEIDCLISEIDNRLGKTKTHNLIVLGYGNIGKAVVKYPGFENEKIKIIAAFENDESKVEKDSEVPVLPLSELEEFIKNNKIEIAVLALPANTVQKSADCLINYGIKGFLNFSSTHVKANRDVFVHNVDLNMAIETIIFYIHSPMKNLG